MLISETFYSIQGEGSLTGVPAFFIRTAGCNLRCRWCDSKYAWRARGKDRSVLDLVREAGRHPTRFSVLTGGEPMIADGIHDLARRLVDDGRHVTIETAGTIPPRGIACSLASISPKLGNSVPGGDASPGARRRHEANRLRPEVVRDWIDHCEYQLKFVVGSPDDITEVVDFLAGLRRAVPPEKVLLMPEGVETGGLDKAGGFIVAACKKHGFRFCDRLHIRLFGNRRGR